MLAPNSAEQPWVGQPLAGRTAVVTGASTGIGRAIACELAAAGANVMVHAGRRQMAAEETAAAVVARGRQSWVLMADLGEVSEQDRLVEEAWKLGSRIDIWINNAGADVLTGAAAGWDFETKLERLWRVDVVATMRLSRQVGQRMLADRERANGLLPSIMTVGWDQAERGMEGDSGEMFAATKGAIMAFTRSLAKSLAPHVRVNCLAPGWIRTAWGESTTSYWHQRACREALLGRWGSPEDVARVATFLASPASAFITGHILPINGGSGSHG